MGGGGGMTEEIQDYKLPADELEIDHDLEWVRALIESTQETLDKLQRVHIRLTGQEHVWFK